MRSIFQNYKRNKKGNAIIEGLTIIVVITIFAIMGLFSSFLFDELDTDMQNNDELSAEAKNVSQHLEGIYSDWYDAAFLTVFILFVVFVLVSVFVIDTHPIFFIISVLLLLSVIIVAIVMGNAYNQVASSSTISAYANQMTYMNFVMSNIVEMIIAIGFMVSIALYVKFKML